ncbi:IS1 family transposase [Spirosoma endophyticum]|uniref:IS1 family transposase n=1 Tax=Spirosoma endophyticum TaxID=662367 RepID=UPI000B82DB34
MLRSTHTLNCKKSLQGLERKHLTLRTRLKRLTRRTICFSNQTAGAVSGSS